MNTVNKTEVAAVATINALVIVTAIGLLLAPGEIYAGISLGKDGAEPRHLILLPGQVSGKNWSEGMTWAESIGGTLPTRREQSLLFANLKEEFEGDWYWSGEQHADGSDFAWGQNFGDGYQGLSLKSSKCRARAVRRLPI